ncbi:MAG: hypothetical protein ACRD43_04565, partial [Pyrinomonadaceae bacterium]
MHTQGQTQPATEAEAVELQLAQQFDRDIAGGEKHTFKVQLGAKQYAKIVVQQHGIDVLVQEIGEDGNVVIKFSSLAQDPDRVEAEIVSQNAGTFLLTVEAPQKAEPKGKYGIHLQEIRPAGDH